MMLGNVATGDDFFGRKRDLQRLSRYLKGNHIVLRGPRRLGKTSLLRKLGENAKALGFHSIYTDVGSIGSCVDFFAHLEQAIPDETIAGLIKKASKAVSGATARTKKIEVKVAGTGIEWEGQQVALGWLDAAERLRDRLSELPLLIMIDEFSVFIERLIKQDREQADALLS